MSRRTAAAGTANALSTALLKHGETKIVGVYGLPASGKTYLLHQLQSPEYFGGEDRHATFLEGSAILLDLCPDRNLEAFNALPDNEKARIRGEVAGRVRDSCHRLGNGMSVAAGHFSIWNQERQEAESVWTGQDGLTYTHVLHVATDPKDIHERLKQDDGGSGRLQLDTFELQTWQDAEIVEFRRLCYARQILFMVITAENVNVQYVYEVLHNIKTQSREADITRAKSIIDNMVASKEMHHPVRTMLVFDADRTLSDDDTGRLIWEDRFSDSQEVKDPLVDIFHAFSFNYSAFRQIQFLHQETYPGDKLNVICEEVASEVEMYSEMVTLLRLAATVPDTIVIVITCGLELVWKKILTRHGLSWVPVLGSGHLGDLVVGPDFKADIVMYARKAHGFHVTAFGDSTVDLEMFAKADRAVVVTGAELTRSEVMDTNLQSRIRDGLIVRPRQVLLPEHDKPTLRLDSMVLPVISSLTDQGFLRNLFQPLRELNIIHATDKHASKLLTVPTRDIGVSGVMLREAHHNIGWYLATEYLAEVLGAEEYEVPNAQGSITKGYRIKGQGDNSILVISLLRSGEPMALGVADVLPDAPFLQSKAVSAVTKKHLEEKEAVILVDSAIITGKIMLEFVPAIRRMNADIHIVMMTNVIQEKAIGILDENLCDGGKDKRLSLIALRVSKTKHGDSGGIDIEERLFNLNTTLGEK